MAKHKTIDRWKLDVVTGSHENDDFTKIVIEVPVMIEQSKHEIAFIIDFKYGDHRLVDRDKDINALRDRTRKWLAGVVTFKWDDFFYVEFSGPTKERHEDPTERSVSTYLVCRHYQCATNHQGKKVYRDLSKRMNSGNVTQGVPEVGTNCCSMSSWRNSDCVRALVPMTPETQVALTAIAEGFVTLSEKLRILLSTDQIAKSLLDLSAATLAFPLHTLRESKSRETQEQR